MADLFRVNKKARIDMVRAFAHLGARRELLSPGMLVGEELVHAGDHLEGVGDVDDVGLAASPAAIGVERYGTALGNETPADDVRLFAMAAG